jgi:hypothetical protein
MIAGKKMHLSYLGYSHLVIFTNAPVRTYQNPYLFISILLGLLKISINASIKAKKSQKRFCSIKYHFSISLDARIQISLPSHHHLHCQLVIKDFYNPKNKSLQDLGFIVSQSLRFVTDIDKTRSKIRQVSFDQTTLPFLLSDESGWIQSTYPILDLKEAFSCLTNI